MKSIALKINHRQHEDRALWITLLLLLLLAGLRPAHASEAQLDLALANLLQGVDLSVHLEERRSREFAEDRYEIRPGDTLDGLINRLFPGTAIRRDMLRQVLVTTNPQAFRGQNPNWMLAGKVLRLPREADFLALMFNDPAAMTEALMPDPSSWVRFP